MPPSPTKYCLQELTDYTGFESLCHDLMALEGYPKIEPLGGFNDKGRDALHLDRSGLVTIFAYSVREDWRAKLAEDRRSKNTAMNVTKSSFFVLQIFPLMSEMKLSTVFVMNMDGD
jgi:hypothetical protein